MRSVMVSWVGNNDILSIEEGKLTGPVYALLSSRYGTEFNEIYLLCNYSEKKSEGYFKMLKKKFDINFKYASNTDDPMDYKKIYEEVENYLSHIINMKNDNDINWHFHTSPGTQAMSSVWVLLGKTKYNAKLYNSWLEKGNQRVEGAKIPFDISYDYLPELFRQKEKSILDNWDKLPVFEKIIHDSDRMKEVLQKSIMIGKYNVPVLILGETGTGKELIANAIHNNSNRESKPFKAVNCGAIPETLIEAMLFGWSKGAYTGSVGEGKGIFLECDKGTLFLDEIGDLSSNLQVKLLRVLQECEISRIGDNKTFKTDVRIITATNKNLTEMVMENTFREDLFHRIAIGIIEIPPLRERGSKDIIKIAEHFLDEINKRFSEPVKIHNKDIENPYIKKEFTLSALKYIKGYNWPGNVRELNNTITRACLWNSNDKIDKNDIKNSIIKFSKKTERDIDISDDGIDLNKTMFDIEKKYIELALSRTGSKREAAKLLGVNQKTFEKKCRTKFNL